MVWHAASSGLGRGSSRSIGIGGDHFTGIQGDQSPQGHWADRRLDEMNAAVTEKAVYTAGMKREQFIVGPALLPPVPSSPGKASKMPVHGSENICYWGYPKRQSRNRARPNAKRPAGPRLTKVLALDSHPLQPCTTLAK